MKTAHYALALSLVVCIAGCKNKNTSPSSILTFDAQAAIDNRQTFALDEIAERVEFIALESVQTESLVGNIFALEGSETGFYIHDGIETPVKYFDKTGKFHSTRGRIGNGPGEFNFLRGIAVDYKSDNVYMRTYPSNILMYDSSNRVVVETSSISPHTNKIVSYNDQLIVINYPYVEPDMDGNVTFIDIFSSDLKHQGKIKIPHKATNNFFIRGSQILSNNGKELLVKEPLSDTVFYYREHDLVPAYKLDMGKYFFSQKMWDASMEEQWNNHYLVSQLYEGSRYRIIMVDNGYFGAREALVFDKNEPLYGFMTVGPNGKSGLFVGGVKFTPCYIRDNRLFGYMSALDIVDNAAGITDPKLKEIAATLKEDSNPVMVVAELNR
jgi:hypothetical protein